MPFIFGPTLRFSIIRFSDLDICCRFKWFRWWRKQQHFAHLLQTSNIIVAADFNQLLELLVVLAIFDELLESFQGLQLDNLLKEYSLRFSFILECFFIILRPGELLIHELDLFLLNYELLLFIFSFLLLFFNSELLLFFFSFFLFLFKSERLLFL